MKGSEDALHVFVCASFFPSEWAALIGPCSTHPNGGLPMKHRSGADQSAGRVRRSYFGPPALALDADGATALAFDGGGDNHIEIARMPTPSLITDLGVPAERARGLRGFAQGQPFLACDPRRDLEPVRRRHAPGLILTLPIGWRGLNGARLARIMETYLNTIRAWSAGHRRAVGRRRRPGRRRG